MLRAIPGGAIRVVLVVGILAGLTRFATAQTLVERSAEARFQLDLQVPDAALMKFLPPGWTLNVSTQGAAKDANLRAIFVDRLTITDPDGESLGMTGSNRLVYLAAPATNPAGENVQLVISGLTEDPADAPGPLGVYLAATTHVMERSSTVGAGPVLDSQDWVFEAATGEHLEMHIEYERGVSSRPIPAGPRERKFYSAKDPSVYQISREEQALDIMRNVTTNPPDRVKSFSFTGGGGSYAALFDGTERLLSWDNILWLTRSVLVP